MKKIYIVFACILQSIYSLAQVSYQSAFGDTMKDNGSKVIKMSSGGYCIVGPTGQNVPDGTDIAVYFVDDVGDMNSSVRVGLSKDDFPTGVEETPDQGFIITGTTYSSPLDLTHTDIFAVKINSIGDVQWANVYGGADDDEANSLLKTPDNYFIITGSTKSFGSAPKSGLVMKIDENGNLIWSSIKNFSGQISYFNQCDLTFDNKYILGGGTFNGIDDDNYIVELDTTGLFVWGDVYSSNGAGSNGAEWITDIKTTSDSGFIAASLSTVNTIGDTDQCILKYKPGVGLQWAYNYGTPQDDRSYSVIENAAHHFIVCGYTNVDTSGGQLNQFLMDEIDESGNLIWSTIYGDSLYECEGYYLIPGNDGGYAGLGFSVAFGEPNGDAVFVKTDNSGFTGCGEFPVQILQGSNTLFHSVDNNSPAQLVTLNVAPVIMNGAPFTNSYAMLCFTDNVNDNLISKNSNYNSAKIYPNPAGSLLNIDTDTDEGIATIYDQFGRKVFYQKLFSEKTTIDISTLSQGIYFLHINSKNNFTVNKFIKN